MLISINQGARAKDLKEKIKQEIMKRRKQIIEARQKTVLTVDASFPAVNEKVVKRPYKINAPDVNIRIK